MSKEKDNKIAKLENQIDELNTEIDRLKKLVPREKSEEELLLLREIKHIDFLSQSGGLNFNETKQLKMLMDSLVALRRVDKNLPEETDKRIKNDDVDKLLKIVKEENDRTKENN